MSGDLVYFVMPVPDGDRGKAFSGGLFGQQIESGWMADCKDDQDTRFSIWSPAPGK